VTVKGEAANKKDNVLNYILMPPSKLENPIRDETAQINRELQNYERGQE
jgi:hypothetical protein